MGSLDVHYSSGVANHFYYLLAQGSNGSPASPTCNGSTVTGIGRAAAEKIWYRALTVYMTSGTKYSAARTATLNAAKDLYGSGSTQYNAVAAAWSAVSVNESRAGPVPSGPEVPDGPVLASSRRRPVCRGAPVAFPAGRSQRPSSRTLARRGGVSGTRPQ